MYLINFVNFASLLPKFFNKKQFRHLRFKMMLFKEIRTKQKLELPVNCYFSSLPYMKKLLELHCKDGAGTVDIKNVNKKPPLKRD